MHIRHSSQARVRLTRLVFGSLLATVATLALAGPADPPLELLYSPESRLVRAELVEINPSGRLVFKREKVLGESKDVPELIDASVTTNALMHARIGEHYIVAYTISNYDKQYPEGITPSRKRTSVISSSGLDPAMFVDSPELRRILDLAATERGRESTKLRRLLLKTFSEDTPVLQRLAAGQFALDTEMSAKLSSREKSLLQAAAFNDQINPTTRSLLITAAVNRPNDFGTWATGAINKVLENTPVDGYPTGTADHTGLVLLAFTEAMDRGIEVPYQTLARWLRSSHQLYLERASSLLQMRYPERSRSAFEEALGKTDPESKAYRFLEGKLRDVKRQDVGTDAQKH